MSPLPATPSESGWPAEILQAAKEEFDGEIEVTTPGTPGTWENGVITGGTPGTTILSRRAARIQHIRMPLEVSDGNGWGTKRRVRVQCEIEPGDQFVSKGQLVIIHDGGRDPSLTSLVLQVESAINSDHAALRTIECVTEASPT